MRCRDLEEAAFNSMAKETVLTTFQGYDPDQLYDVVSWKRVAIVSTARRSGETAGGSPLSAQPRGHENHGHRHCALDCVEDTAQRLLEAVVSRVTTIIFLVLAPSVSRRV